MNELTPRPGHPGPFSMVECNIGICCKCHPSSAWLHLLASAGALAVSDSTAWCWGSTYAHLAAAAPAGVRLRELSCGGLQCCAIRDSDMTLVCWGQPEHSAAPPQAAALKVSCGHSHCCAVVALNGTIACWGNPDIPAAPANLSSATYISCGDHGCCALRAGQPVCWGTAWLPTTAAGFHTISCGRSGCCGVQHGGAVLCTDLMELSTQQLALRGSPLPDQLSECPPIPSRATSHSVELLLATAGSIPASFRCLLVNRDAYLSPSECCCCCDSGPRCVKSAQATGWTLFSLRYWESLCCRCCQWL